ncbi:SusC/RagA family TonB-linked outer membrane protein [Zobellia alginiliquefaciens]|uniref:SusC/RagA family TonB-linked outer membrane protein n=1 Tax=Zobellia alginiliquefaciens TaxID=3032586 RepID=UPI0023E43CC4|nr:SusC/RagA family TonB-linked outer membrane protein [Zobellia alginiliquefaciens]
MKIMLLKNLVMVAAFLGFGIAQAQDVSGTVSDASGPLPGASVVIKGSTTGAQTDFDGNYSLSDVPEGATLIFSYIGFATQEVPVNGQSTINVTLQEDAQALDEVVIIGYGTTTVKDATGSVTAVKAEDFNGGVIASPEQLIQGKSAGVQISQSSGEPGAGVNIRIRGANSIRSNNNPLFVVDGVPLSGESTTPDGGNIVNGGNATKNPLSFINPSDIESISILKDASATAIYGSRGANGVVIVTTKSGKAGSGGNWEFNSTFSVSSPADEYDLFDGPEFISKSASLRSQEIADGLDFGQNTDWQDYITRNTASQNQNLAYSNNYGSGNVRTTFSYGKQFGVIQKSSQERITGRVNVAQRFLDDKLRVNFQSTLSRVNDEAPPISGTSGSSGNLIGAAYAANPTWPSSSTFSIDGNLVNPANYLANWQSETHTDRFLANLSAEYDITEELTGKISVGYDRSDAQAITVISPGVRNFDRVVDNGQAAFNTLEATSKLLEATLNYKKEFSNSTLDAIVGFTFQDFQRQGINSQGWGTSLYNLDKIGQELKQSIYDLRYSINRPYQQFGYDASSSFVNSLNPFDDEGTLNRQSDSFRSVWGNAFDNTDELQSFFGRINYSLNSKYLFTVTLRADGSSRFGTNNKYGYFPSGAFAWQLAEEDFIGDAFSTLKLRVSAGATGNQEGLGYANYLKRVRFSTPNIDNDGSINRPGTETVAVQNSDLKWESTTDYNLGIDFGFADDRFNGSIDLYRRETKDLLFRQPAAAPAFDPFKFTNLEDGTLINQGVELGLNYDFIQSEDINFSTSFNIAYNDNTVEGLNGATADFGVLNGPGLTGAFAQRLGEGRSLFSYYMATYSEDADGNPNFNADDKDFVGEDAVPDITTGLALNLTVKNWDVSAFFTGQFGFSVYNNTANAFLNAAAFNTSRNVTPEALELQSSEVSTLYLEKGDFVRMQNASIGYNVPLSGKGALNSLRLSLTGQNLFLITDYSGLDPEVSSSTSSDGDFTGGIPSQGIDYTSFPRPRTFTLGINARF